jgi:hypothetical protein
MESGSKPIVSQPIYITELIVAPKISIRNLDKIKAVYPRSAALSARFYLGIN